VQAPPPTRMTQSVKSRFLVCVPMVQQEQQGLVEEDVLSLRLGDSVFVVLAGVSIVPIEAGNVLEIDHLVYDHHIRGYA